MSDKEAAANAAIKAALQALLHAQELSKQAKYGSLVLGPLAEAQLETQYAYDTAMGRN